MDIDNKLRQYMQDTPIPESLEPENIAQFLNSRIMPHAAKPAAQSESARPDFTQPSKPGKPAKAPAPDIEPVRIPSSKRTVWARAIAGIAACAVIGIGLFAHFTGDRAGLDTTGSASSDATARITAPESYGALFAVINGYYQTSYRDEGVNSVALDGAELGVTEDVAEAPAQASGNGDDKSADKYSATNEQVEGVAEADIVKTDGEYIYYISGGRLLIVNANGGEMQLVSTTERADISAREMFLVNNRLVVISNESSSIELPIYKDEPVDDVATQTSPAKNADTPVAPDEPANQAAGGTEPSEGNAASVAGSAPAADIGVGVDMPALWYNYYNTMLVEIYDISDKANPTVAATYEQNGSYNTARMIGNNLYLVSNYQNFGQPKSEEDLDSFVPFYYENGEKLYIEPVDICLPARIVTDTYTVVSGLDVTQASPLISTKALLGYGGSVYASQGSIYVTSNDYRDEQSFTSITRFAVDGGMVTQAASGSVGGYLLNQFSMDEYGGNFRLATTTNEWTTFTDGDAVSYKSNTYSTLYVLDQSLNEIGRADHIGVDETIQSVRFDENLAYVVTFKQTDPLFCFDLSDPAKPVKLDDLKVTGFSTYMHTWSDSLLLGFGNEADAETGMTTGLKLSMFDTADLSNLSELYKTYFNGESGNVYEYSNALYDHKALLIDPEKDLIGIPVQYYDGFTNVNQYFVFGYDPATGFYQKGVLEYHDADSCYTFERGLYIGEVLYALSPGRIVAARLDDMAVISKLDLGYQDNTVYYPVDIGILE